MWLSCCDVFSVSTESSSRIQRQGDFDNHAGEGRGREFNRVEPSQRSSLYGAVIEIEPTNIEEDFHGRDSILRKGEGTLPRQNAGAAPEGTAPRPAVETNGRDVSEYLTGNEAASTRAFMKKKQGPRLAATAPRPFAEATGRDDVEKLRDELATFKKG